MKKGNKTKIGFLRFAILAMVMSLVSSSLSAQESFYNNSLAEFSKKMIMQVSKEVFHNIYEYKVTYKETNSEPIEAWMITPSDWKNNKAINLEERDFEEDEMVLEGWMMQTNWEDYSKVDEELQMEGWMMDLKSW